MTFLQAIAEGFALGSQGIISFKIILSTLLGFSIGWNRKSKNAGIRTFTLITLGATIFTIISIDGFPHNAPVADQARLVAQIVSGIGFIGAGVIWKGDKALTGLTTAAGIWIAAAIGVAVGTGMFLLAITSTILTLLILYMKKYLKKYEHEEEEDD